MDSPNYDKEQALLTQKNLLEQKRNRLNGIIELISDVMKGVNTMSFEAFTNEDVQKIVNHTLESMSKEHIDEQVKIGEHRKIQRAFIIRFYKRTGCCGLAEMVWQQRKSNGSSHAVNRKW